MRPGAFRCSALSPRAQRLITRVIITSKTKGKHAQREKDRERERERERERGRVRERQTDRLTDRYRERGTEREGEITSMMLILIFCNLL